MSEKAVGEVETVTINDSRVQEDWQARLFFKKSSPRIEVNREGAPVFVNSKRVKPPFLFFRRSTTLPSEPFEITIASGRFLVKVEDGLFEVKKQDEGDIALVAQNICWSPGNNFSIKNVSFPLYKKSFHLILGVSGSGKSSALKIIAGREPPRSGKVLVDGKYLYENLESLSEKIGYIPQSVILHDSLTLEEVLQYANRLRTGKDASNALSYVKKVGLKGQTMRTVIKRLSGGEKKRASMAMELMDEPSILLLDEVTSGLDPGTDRDMMQLFKGLAGESTVALVTHNVSYAEFCDYLIFFIDGALVFYGSLKEALDFFKVSSIDEVYSRINEMPPGEAVKRYVNEYKDYKTKRGKNLYEYHVKPSASNKDVEENTGLDRKSNIRNLSATDQFLTLLERYSILCSKDFKFLGLLLGLAPAVAFIVLQVGNALAAVNEPHLPFEWDEVLSQQRVLTFTAVLTSMFISLFCSLREFVKEKDIYIHERFSGLQARPYYFSKFVFLAFLGIFQCASIILILKLYGGWLAGDGLGGTFYVFFILYLMSLAGTSLGLLISAVAKTSDWASNVLILVVIPQMLLSGAVAEVRGVVEWFSITFISTFHGYAEIQNQFPADLKEFLDESATESLMNPDLDTLWGSLGLGPSVLHVVLIVSHIMLCVFVTIKVLNRQGVSGRK